MFTNNDKNLIHKWLKEGKGGEILLICMMRNGATMEELQEMDAVVHGNEAYAINTTIKYAAKYLVITDVMNDDYH